MLIKSLAIIPALTYSSTINQSVSEGDRHQYCRAIVNNPDASCNLESDLCLTGAQIEDADGDSRYPCDIGTVISYARNRIDESGKASNQLSTVPATDGLSLYITDLIKSMPASFERFHRLVTPIAQSSSKVLGSPPRRVIKRFSNALVHKNLRQTKVAFDRSLTSHIASMTVTPFEEAFALLSSPTPNPVAVRAALLNLVGTIEIVAAEAAANKVDIDTVIPRELVMVLVEMFDNLSRSYPVQMLDRE